MNIKFLIKIVTTAFSISAIVLITLAILSKNGITYYEHNLIIKYLETAASIIVILLLIWDLRN